MVLGDSASQQQGSKTDPKRADDEQSGQAENGSDEISNSEPFNHVQYGRTAPF